MCFRSKYFLVLLVCLLNTLISQASIVVNEMPVLFIDDMLIANTQNVRRVIHKAEKLPSPVIEPQKPWERSSVYCSGTALYDEEDDVFKLWYKSGGTCYAWSYDGVNWVKPDLSLHSYDGNFQNNIVFPRNCITVYYDEYENDIQKRFKMMGTDGAHAFWAAYSANGKNWAEYPGNPVLTVGSEIIDIIRQGNSNQFLGYIRPQAPQTEVTGLSGKRYIGLITTQDFQNWSSIQNIIVPDAVDDTWVTESQQRTEFYQMAGFKYGDMYLGMLQVFRVTDIIPLEERLPGQSQYDGPIHSELVYSRDGVAWNRYEPGTPVIENGPYDYDAGCIMFAANQPVLHGGKIYHYYTAINTTHGGVPEEKVISIALASWREDGYVSMRADAAEGIIETETLAVNGNTLVINADAEFGSIAVELADENGQVISEYSREQCYPVAIDGLRQKVRWQTKDTIPDQPFKIRFYLQNADLYSFTIDDGTGNYDETDTSVLPPTTGLVCQLNAQGAETAFYDSQKKELLVEKIIDGSGNGNHALQTETIMRPALLWDDLVEQKVIKFSGLEELVVPHNLSLNTDVGGGYTVFALARHDGPIDAKQIWLDKGCTVWAGYDPGWSFWFYDVSGTDRMYMSVATEGVDDADHHAMTYKNIGLNTYSIYSMVLNGNEIDMRVNGEPRDGTVSFHWDYTGNLNNTADINIGGENISILEILVYNRMIDEAERLSIEQYLNNKYPQYSYPPSSCHSVWKYGLGLKQDLNRDCYVTIEDLVIFCENWIKCYNPTDPSCFSFNY